MRLVDGLADRQQANLGRVAPDGPAGSRDAAAHRGKVVLEVGDRCGVRVQG